MALWCSVASGLVCGEGRGVVSSDVVVVVGKECRLLRLFALVLCVNKRRKKRDKRGIV